VEYVVSIVRLISLLKSCSSASAHMSSNVMLPLEYRYPSFRHLRRNELKLKPDHAGAAYRIFAWTVARMLGRLHSVTVVEVHALSIRVVGRWM